MFTSLLVTLYFIIASTPLLWRVSFPTQLFQAVVTVGMAVTWLAFRSARSKQVTRTGLEWPLALLAVSQLVATAFSAQPRLSLDSAATTLFWILSFLILADVIAHSWSQRLIREALIVAAIAVAGHGLLELGDWLGSWLSLGLWPPVTYRLRGLLGSNFTAALCNLLLPVVLVELLAARKWRTRSGLGLLASGLVVVVYFASSRAAWIAGAMAMGVLTTLLAIASPAGEDSLRRRIEQRWRATGPRLRVTGLVGLTALAVASVWLLSLQSNHFTHYRLFDSRDGIWSVAWEQFRLHSVLGMGPGLFAWFWSHEHSSPPNWFAGHAHSLVLQVLGGSGGAGLLALLACVAAAALRLRHVWREATNRKLLAGLIAGVASIAIHSLFDLPLSANFLAFLTMTLLTLAFAQARLTAKTTAKTYHPAWLAAPVLLVAAITGYSLRASFHNHQALALAQNNKWLAAAPIFERAAQDDPGLTLYWEQAAYAYARAGLTYRALEVLSRAQAGDPHWAMLPATVAMLAQDTQAMQAALDLAPRSDFLTLNQGVLFENQGERALASQAYLRALELRPAIADSLFWEQTNVRQLALAAWQRDNPEADTPVRQAWQSLSRQQLVQAQSQFEIARLDQPFDPAAYWGLAEVWWRRGDAARAHKYLETARMLLLPSVDYHRTRGDWLMSAGELDAGMNAYKLAFDSIYAFTIAGPGPNSYGDRNTFVFRRESLGTDLVLEFARPEVTAELDSRFAQLGEYYLATNRGELGCYVLMHARNDAPVSRSSQAWEQWCGGPVFQDLGWLDLSRTTRQAKRGLPSR